MQLRSSNRSTGGPGKRHFALAAMCAMSVGAIAILAAQTSSRGSSQPPAKGAAVPLASGGELV